MSVRQIFSRQRRRAVRARAVRQPVAGADFLVTQMTEEIAERLAWVSRSFANALIIGEANGAVLQALAARGISALHAHHCAATGAAVVCDEDLLPFADASFDLVICIGVLDSVNDVPGALTLMRRILRPDGLLLAAFVGAGSLPRMRAALLAAEGDRAAPHIHPQIDVRASGDLLARVGFAMPVADSDTLVVRYSGLEPLVRDLRGMGAGNVMADSRAPLTRDVVAKAAAHFAARADADGKTAETFNLVYLSGWAPAPTQAKPARRGSATVSLAQALKGK